MNDKWVALNHTADIMLEIFGRTFDDLVVHSAEAMMSLLADNSQTRTPQFEFEMEIYGEDKEELLINWLRELLYVHQTKRLMVQSVNIIESGENHFKAKVFGTEKTEDDEIEIKAVTYHGFSVQSDNSGFRATVVFDI